MSRFTQRELEEGAALLADAPLREDGVAGGREEADGREVRLDGEVDGPASPHVAGGDHRAATARPATMEA